MKTQAVIVSLLFVAACGGSTTEKPDAEICEHLKAGPSAAVTATAATSGAPSVSTSHTRYDVALVDVTGGKGGSVSFASTQERDHTIALSENVPLKVTDSTGAEVASESSATSSEGCTEIKGRHVVPLKVGTYTLTFGPTTTTTVQMVVEAAHDEH